MNHKKVKKQINKINSFYDSITADDEVSKIEKDLLLSYIRKLYEAVTEEDKDSAKPEKQAKRETPKAKEAIKEEPARVEKIVEEVVKPPVAAERKPFEKAPPVEVAAPPIAEEVVNVAPVTKVAQTVAASEEVAEVVLTPKEDLSENMINIFEQASGNELSDKLGSLPIKDLTKSMGINERMFTVKELFGGDQNLMNTVLSDLNGMNNFEEAKSYLIAGVAKDLEWDSASTYKKAINFVKLVQRRYS